MRRGSLVLAGLLLAGPVQAQDLVAEAGRGCRLRVEGLTDLARHLAVDWNGACRDGLAEGPGQALIRWREGRYARGMTFAGTLRAGRPEGEGLLVHLRDGMPTIVEQGLFRDGDLAQGRVGVAVERAVYEGALRDGLPHGPGRVTRAGAVAEGSWSRGCLFLEGGGWMAFLRAPEACEAEAP